MEALKEVESEVVNVENCESDNRKLKASSSKRRKKVEQGTSTTLPHDIIVIILLYLPVKDLIRYKVVSKQWKATISDPSFAQTHLQRYKNSSTSRNLLTWFNSIDLVFPGFYVAKLQKNQFERMSKIEFPRKSHLLCGSHLICNCDGLYLIRLYNTLDQTYVVCNPSCKGYKEIRCPQKLDDRDSSQSLHGIYYNPLVKDYSVVISDTKYYSVFSCRYNRWSDVKEMEEIYCSRKVPGIPWLPGVSFSGSLYWLDTKRVSEANESVIICFDGKDEKFKKIDMPDCKGGRNFYLASSPDHLCLSYISRHNEMIIMKTVKGDEKDSWMEFKVQLESIPRRFSKEWIHPVWVSEDVIMFGEFKNYYMIYDVSKSTVVTRKYPFGRTWLHPLPYLESLFLQ